jgi:hypothetical protein
MNETDIDDYLRGQRDCKDGMDARVGQSSNYYNGYAIQYEAEQMLTEMNLRQETIH